MGDECGGWMGRASSEPIPVVFLAQVKAVFLHGLLGRPKGAVHWLLLHLNRIKPACLSLLSVSWGEGMREKVIVDQHYYPVMRSDVTCVQAEERAGSDNYCGIMSSCQGI